jgi:hypothetical protein
MEHWIKAGLFFGMAGDDLILDLVVGGFGKNAAGEELVFGGVGTAVDDAFGVGVSDAGECLELVGRGCVDVELVGGGGLGGGGWFGLRYGTERKGEQECGGQELVTEMEHSGLLERHGFTCGRVRERADGVNEFHAYLPLVGLTR